jgi:hypothetical protein
MSQISSNTPEEPGAYVERVKIMMRIEGPAAQTFPCKRIIRSVKW